jgi:microcystin-dependent protein/predicted  nucleic acid-binding Zn-ribbon protein
MITFIIIFLLIIGIIGYDVFLTYKIYSKDFKEDDITSKLLKLKTHFDQLVISDKSLNDSQTDSISKLSDKITALTATPISQDQLTEIIDIITQLNTILSTTQIDNKVQTVMDLFQKLFELIPKNTDTSKKIYSLLTNSSSFSSRINDINYLLTSINQNIETNKSTISENKLNIENIQALNTQQSSEIEKLHIELKGIMEILAVNDHIQTLSKQISDLIIASNKANLTADQLTQLQSATSTLNNIIPSSDILNAFTDIETLKANIKDLKYKIIPVGSIIPYSGVVAPLNYLICDGSVLKISEYPALFAVIQNRYNKIDLTDPVNTFNIPDLRGEFLRGLDNNRGIDKNRRLGTFQPQSTQDHKHAISTSTRAGGGNFYGDYVNWVAVGTMTDIIGETYPRNIAINYIIKVI